MTEKKKSEILSLYDTFCATEDPKQHLQLRKQMESLLSQEESRDPEASYLLGLVYYMSNDDPQGNLPVALKKFLQALEIDPLHNLARLYTGHCYQDQEDFQIALEHYKQVDKEAIKAFQMWRYVKLIEQMGFCSYKTGNIKEGEAHFKEVLQWYQKLPTVDRAIPSEMLACLPEDHEYVVEMKKIEDYL